LHRIMKAGLADLDRLHEIEVECFGEDAYSKSILRLLLMDERTIALKLIVDGDLAGFIIGRVEGVGGRLIGRIYTIDVRPEHRGMGYGRSLMQAMEDEFRRMGCVEAVLEVEAGNIPAINLYRSLGYEFRGRIRGYYGPGRDALIARKRLG